MYSSNNSRPLQIMIVDDDRDDQLIIRDMINKEIPGASVESVYDGSEALGYFGSCLTCPDLILLDLNMSVLSGRDTLKILRKNDNLKDVPVIILSTTRSETEKQQVLKLGANAFYTKPSSNNDLMNIIREIKSKWLVKKAQSA